MAENLLNICRGKYMGYMETGQCPHLQIHTKRVCLDEDLSDEDLRFIRSQNLKSLELKKLHYCRRFHTAIINDAANGRNFVVNLPETLNAFLSSLSQERLKSLSVYGPHLVFTDDWMSETTKMLPSLVELDLSFCPVNNDDFEIICSNLPKMKHLSLSSTDVTNITGVSKLQDLEILDLADLVFESHKAIQDLSTLQKLRVLDISGRSHNELPNLKYYLQNGTVLTELRFLDVAQNELVSNDIEQLGNTHKMLSKISVIETSIERHNIETTNAELKLLKVGNLKECLESFRFYSAPYKFEKINHIVEIITMIIGNDYENQLESDLQECFNLAIVPLKSAIRIGATGQTYLFYFALLCSERRSQMFNLDQKQNLLNVMFDVLQIDYHVDGGLSDAIYNLHTLAWRILFVIYGELQTQDNINALYDVALLEVARAEDADFDFWQLPLNFLSQHYNQVSSEHLEQCLQHDRLIEKLLGLTREQGLFGDEIFARIITLIHNIVERNEPIFVGKINRVLNNLMEIVVDYGQQNNDLRQTLILNVVREIVVVSSLEVSQKLFHNHSATLLFPLLQRENGNQQLRRDVTGLWLSAFALNEGNKHGIMESFLESISENITAVIENIENNRDAFIPATVSCQFWRTLESVMTDEELIQWVRWISNGCVFGNTFTHYFSCMSCFSEKMVQYYLPKFLG